MHARVWHVTGLRQEDRVGELAIHEVLPIGCNQHIVNAKVGD